MIPVLAASITALACLAPDRAPIGDPAPPALPEVAPFDHLRQYGWVRVRWQGGTVVFRAAQVNGQKLLSPKTELFDGDGKLRWTGTAREIELRFDARSRLVALRAVAWEQRAPGGAANFVEEMIWEIGPGLPK